MSDQRGPDADSRDYQGERLQRVLAQRGVASRRAAEQFITAGRVQVNGRAVTELGTRVNPNRDEIRVDGRILHPQRPRHIILNKPSGFITTVNDERDRWTVMDLVDVPERVYPVGRLDRATQGLILLTNDGDLAHRVMHPSYRVDKEYLAFTGKRPTEAQLKRLRDGIEIDGRLIVPEEVRLFRESEEGVAIRVVIHEGLYHVVRRMMDTVGIDMTRLLRTRLGPLRIQGIPGGAWRDLTPGELVQVYEAVGMPAEDAEEANSRRTIVRNPVGGYTHRSASGGTAPARQQAAPSEPRGGDRREGGGERRERRGHHDSIRPSQGDRDRRSGGRRKVDGRGRGR
jgi:23S rRNA pseudouridine2605 synthase